MSRHRIRLAGPWETQDIDAQLQPVGERLRCQLPCSLIGSGGHCGVRLARGFHRPTGIGGTTTLRIVLKADTKPREARVNQAEMFECAAAGDGEYAYDATGRIDSFNQLQLSFACLHCRTPVSLHAVWLEIED